MGWSRFIYYFLDSGRRNFMKKRIYIRIPWYVFLFYRGFRLLWLPVIITLLFLLDGPKALLISGVSDDSTDVSKRDVSTRKYEQAEKRLYEV